MHPKHRFIVRLHNKGNTTREIAWIADVDPSVVVEAINYSNRLRFRTPLDAIQDEERRGMVRAARRLLQKGYSRQVVFANFCDIVTVEDLAHV